MSELQLKWLKNQPWNCGWLMKRGQLIPIVRIKCCKCMQNWNISHQHHFNEAYFSVDCELWLTTILTINQLKMWQTKYADCNFPFNKSLKLVPSAISYILCNFSINKCIFPPIQTTKRVGETILMSNKSI